jgi:CRISPR/Cas system-associated exonuclease Cas4 (RecB family)
VHAQLEGDNFNYRTELPLEAFGVVGKADVYYANGRILDYKTTRWLTPSRLPYGSHEKQVNIYAAILREMGLPVTSAAIQYIDLSGPTKCRKCNKTYLPQNGQLECPVCGAYKEEAHLGALIFEIPLAPHEEVVETIIERRDALLTSLDTNEPPERERTYLCDYCPFTDTCLV